LKCPKPSAPVTTKTWKTLRRAIHSDVGDVVRLFLAWAPDFASGRFCLATALAAELTRAT